MADFTTLKSQIAEVIKANGVQSITGANFQEQLINLIDTLNAAKVDAEDGKGLSSNDLTDALVSLINSAVQPADLTSAVASAVATLVAVADIVQATGTDTTKVMSQKAVTDGLNGKVSTTDAVLKSDIASEEGSSESKVMSQKAVTNRLAAKANATDVYTKSEADAAISGKADADNVYDKTQVNDLLSKKANSSDIYTQNEVDTRLAKKASTDTLDAEALARQTADNALSEALTGKAATTDVYTKTEQDAMEAAMQALIDRIARDFGRYASPAEHTLQVAKNGAYVDSDSAEEVSNSAYSISSALSLKAGDILLIPSASAVLAACSVVSKSVINTYDEPVIYTYTYDDLGRIASATASFDSSVYAPHYADDEAVTPDYWTMGGDTYDELPSTHEVTKSFYEPLVRQSAAGMPDTGYYVFLASQDMDVVVSGLNATINGGVAVIVGWGIFKNIASNYVGSDRQRVIAEAINSLAVQVDAINDKFNNGIGSLKVQHLKVGREISGLNVNGSFCLRAAGAPSASLIPDNWDFDTYGDWAGIPQFVGQEYADTANRIIYKAIGVASLSDWQRITNA